MYLQEKSLTRLQEPLLSSLLGETITYTSPLATVTENCVVVRDAERRAHTIVAISNLTGLRKSYATQPVLLVVSCALFTLAAASYASKQGVETVSPLAALGVLFLLAFLATRRAAVVFQMGREYVESVRGTYQEATALIRAVEKMRSSAKRAQVA